MCGPSNSIVCIPTLADSVVVAFNEPDARDGTMGTETFCHNYSLAKSSQGTSPPSSQTKDNYMSVVREHYLSQGLTESTVALIMKSWRGSTREQYDIYLCKWLSHCKEKGVPFHPTLQTGIEFLTYLFDKGYTYHQIAMARSALPSVIVMENHCGITFGKHPLVKRVLKGIFEARPVFPKVIGHLCKVLNIMCSYEVRRNSNLPLRRFCASMLATTFFITIFLP